MDSLISVLMIVRPRNLARVQRLVLQNRDVDFCFWVLDGDVESFQDLGVVVGKGAGGRSELINRLVDHARSSEWRIVCDDDVEFGHTFTELVQLAEIRGFEVVQPAHGWRSFSSHIFTIARPWLESRRVSFVEIGPILAVSRGAARVLFPLELRSPMGWGMDIRWAHEHSENVVFGLVDAMPVRHLDRPGAGYAQADAEWRSRREALEAAKSRSVRGVQVTMKRYWRWKS